MQIKSLLTLSIVGLLTTSNALAERPDNLQPVPEAPQPPEQVQSGEAMPLGEPQITIIQRGGDIVHEYRLNGHLYAIKIEPENGLPYYLVDSDGDGNMDGRFFDDNNDAQIITPQWVLHRW